MKHRRLILLVLLATALLVAVNACRREPLGRCGRLTNELASPSKAREAIRLLGEKQGDKTCSKALPELARMFEAGRYRTDILRTVKHMGKEAAVEYKESLDVLREALKHEETDSIAATIIEDWQLSEMKGDLVALLSGESNPKSRVALLKALLSFAAPGEVEDVLIVLALGDPDKQGMRVNVMAVEALAKARSVKGIPAVVKTLFIKDQRGAEMYQAARKALVGIGGKPAAEFLIATLSGENQEIRDFARTRGVPDWEWQMGPKLPQVIGDVGEPMAAMAVAQNMAERLVEPAGITEQAVDAWKMTQSNRITINMLTLSRLGDGAVAPVLAEVIKNPMNDAKQRLDSATALASIGAPAAVEALFTVYRESDDQRFRAPLLRPLALALDTAHLVAFDEIVANETKAKAELVLGRLGGDPIVVAAVDLVRECVNEDTECLVRNLDYVAPADTSFEGREFSKTDYEQSRQWKASIMLARKTDEAAAVVPALLKKFETTPPQLTDLRNYVLIALERVGRSVPAMVEGLQKVREAEKGRGGPFDYWSMELEVRILAFAGRATGAAEQK